MNKSLKERVLAVLRKAVVGSEWMCIVCGASVDEEHTDDCEVMALIRELEK